MQVLLYLDSCTATRIEVRLKCVGGKPVICQVGTDVPNGRLVVKCSVDWLDLGAEMASRGLAIAIERESLDYVQNQ
jgi:endonuclease YncB( thermonuclease family)